VNGSIAASMREVEEEGMLPTDEKIVGRERRAQWAGSRYSVTSSRGRGRDELKRKSCPRIGTD